MKTREERDAFMDQASKEISAILQRLCREGIDTRIQTDTKIENGVAVGTIGQCEFADRIMPHKGEPHVEVSTLNGKPVTPEVANQVIDHYKEARRRKQELDDIAQIQHLATLGKVGSC